MNIRKIMQKTGFFLMITGFFILLYQFIWQCYNWDKPQSVVLGIGLMILGNWLVITFPPIMNDPKKKIREEDES